MLTKTRRSPMTRLGRMPASIRMRPRQKHSGWHPIASLMERDDQWPFHAIGLWIEAAPLSDLPAQFCRWIRGFKPYARTRVGKGGLRALIFRPRSVEI